MCELVHLEHRDEDKTLCGKQACEWIVALLDYPVERFCPDCVRLLVASRVQWKPLTDLPDYTDFVWVERPEGVFLAYFIQGQYRNNQFQVAKTAGDAEGLSTEYYTDVIRWAEIQEPTAP